MADYCTDSFKMVEDNEDSFRMWQGLVGPYYTPSVSNDGTLRWSNNGNLPNPADVNIMGPQGAGIRIAGIRATAEELPATAPEGDIWLVGEGSPYEGWSFTGGEWLDLGPLTVGPAGPPGPQGDDYELTEADKQEIAEISEGLLLQELDTDPLGIQYGGTGAHDLAGAKANLGIDAIEAKLGSWPLGTDAQDVAGAINEMIGEISLQVADIQQLKDNFAGEFSPTSTYAVGAYVTYSGKFYRCVTAVTTAGAWADANWTQVTAGGELKTLKSTFTDLTQVADCNDATEQNRVYYCDSNALHSPSATWYFIRPLYKSGAYVIQLATEMNTMNPNLYIRSKDNSGWYSWTPLHKTGTTTKYGETSISSISAGTTEDKTISYGMTFPSVPEVFLQEYIDPSSTSLENAKTKLYVLDRTTAQFTVRLYNGASINRGARFRWMATL